MKTRLTRALTLFLLLSALLSAEELRWSDRQGEATITLVMNDELMLLSERMQIELIIVQPGGVRWDSDAFFQQWAERLSDGGWRLAKEQIKADGDRLEAHYLIEPSSVGHHAIDLPQVTLDAAEKVTWQLPVLALEVRLPPTDEFPDALPGSALLPLDPDVLIRISPENREQLLGDESVSEQDRQRLLEEFRLRRLLLWLLLCLLAVAACIWIARLAYRRYLSCRQVDEIEKRDPREHALLQLSALQKRQLPQQQLFEAYYTGLTSIVRVFIEEEYGLRAPEQSTEEFLASLSQTQKLPSSAKQMLGSFLQEADLVKYAKGGSSETDCQRAFDSCLSLIENQQDPGSDS